MFTKKSKVPPAPKLEAVAIPAPSAKLVATMHHIDSGAADAERLRKHREAAPPDVAAAYELVAEYERRCP